MLVMSAKASLDWRSGMLFSIILRGTGSGTGKCHVGSGIKRRSRARNGRLCRWLRRVRLARRRRGVSNV